VPHDRLGALAGRTAVVTRRRRRVGEVLDRPEVAMLVNNAGVSTHGEFVQASPEQAEVMVALNVTAVAALSKRAADAFAAPGGRRHRQRQLHRRLQCAT
jgi:short-subunit dehydrogenase